MNASRQLVKEISWALVAKIIFILAVWYVCFSHPITKLLTPAKTAAHYLGDGVVGHVVPKGS